MNANAQDLTPTPEAVLAAARERRAEARAKVETASAAHERARNISAAAQGEAERLTEEEREWIARHATKLEAWIADGSRGNRPTAAADAKAVQRQLSARADAAAAAQALARFEAAEREAREVMAAAERAVEAAVDAFLDARAVQAAERILQGAAELLRIGHRELPNPLHTPVFRLRAQPLVVEQAAALLDKLRPDDLYRPLGELNVPAMGTFRSGNTAYEDRRAALIRGELEAAGEVEPPAPAPEEQAA